MREREVGRLTLRRNALTKRRTPEHADMKNGAILADRPGCQSVPPRTEVFCIPEAGPLGSEPFG